jgi:hypothetical protein
MKTKLTLSVDKDLVRLARYQARSSGKSVSGLFSEFLVTREAQLERLAAPKASTMVGTLKSYSIDDSKTAIRTAYAKKHLN